MGDHLQGKHWSRLKRQQQLQIFNFSRICWPGLRGEDSWQPASHRGELGRLSFAPSLLLQRETFVWVAEEWEPFLSLLGKVEESLGTEPSFSRERSSVAASRHLGGIAHQQRIFFSLAKCRWANQRYLWWGQQRKYLWNYYWQRNWVQREKKITSCSLEGPGDALSVHT